MRELAVRVIHPKDILRDDGEHELDIDESNSHSEDGDSD